MNQELIKKLKRKMICHTVLSGCFFALTARFIILFHEDFPFWSGFTACATLFAALNYLGSTTLINNTIEILTKGGDKE